MLNLKYLQYLKTIYNCKNFTRASEILCVSQLAISSAINTLERELGISTAVSNPIIPKILSDFLEENPFVRISLVEGSMKKHIKMLEKDIIDMAFNAFPEDEDRSSLQIIPVTKAYISVVMHPNHPLAKMDSIPLSLLAGQNLIMMDNESMVTHILSQAFARKALEPNIVFNYEQILCMTNVIRQSTNFMGIISVIKGQRAIGCEDLIVLPVSENLDFNIGLIMRSDKYLSKAGKRMIRFVKNVYMP